MTSPMGFFNTGGYRYESAESRSLGSITRESYDYRDQGKFLSKMAGDVSYMAAYMRKMQKGIDDANQNFIQQIQSFINDIFVLIGGGGDTGLDFGDLKYIFQAVGALFGFDQGNGLPINLFGAAWHFFSNYIFPLDNFQEVINMIIDQAIATILDLFGEVPIIGEALQQLAVIISNIRDGLLPLIDVIEDVLEIFGGNLTTGDLGFLGELIDSLMNIFGDILGPVSAALKPVFETMASWTEPFIEALSQIVEVVTNLIRSITGGLDFTNLTNENFNFFTMIFEIIGNLIRNGLTAIIPIGHLTSQTVEILTEPGFGSTDAISEGEGWAHDPTIGRNSLGSARATAAGVQREILSLRQPVREDQKISFNIWTIWALASFTGSNHLSIGVKTYDENDSWLSSVTLGNRTLNTATQATWQQILGADYIIPDGVSYVRLFIRVNSNVSAGTIWFDDASGKKTGVIQQSWIAGLLDVIETLNGWFEGIIDAILSAIGMIPIFGRPIAGALEDLFDALFGWHDDTEVTAGVASDAKLGLQATQEIIVGGTTGTPPGGPVTDSDVEDAITGQTEVIINQGAAIEALQSYMNGENNAGVTLNDPFDYTIADVETTGEYSKQVLSGTAPKIATDGDHAFIDSNGEVFYRGNLETLTTFQRVTAVVSGKMTYAGFDTRRPHQLVYCRVSADKTKWVRAQFGNDQRLRVQYKNGGSIGTLYDSGHDDEDVKIPSSGEGITIEAGVGTEDNTFRVFRGTKLLATVEDTGLVTDLTQKGVGFGLEQDAGFGCGSFTQFSAVDNSAGSVPGNVFMTYHSGGAAGLGSGTDPLPATFMNIVNYITDACYEYDDTTGELTILKDGVYSCEVRLEITTTLDVNQYATVALYKNTVLNKLGTVHAGDTVGGTGTIPDYNMTVLGVQNNWIVPCKAGDILEAGKKSNVSVSATGDAAGTMSYFAVTKVG